MEKLSSLAQYINVFNESIPVLIINERVIIHVYFYSYRCVNFQLIRESMVTVAGAIIIPDIAVKITYLNSVNE